MEATSHYDAYGKDQHDRVNDYLFFYALMDLAFVRFCEAIGQYGPGYKPPTVYEYRVPLLKRQVSKITDSLEPHKEV
jgi:hypothetical protein